MKCGLRVAAVRYRFEESLFLLPALVMLSGIVLAVVVSVVDGTIGHGLSAPADAAVIPCPRNGWVSQVDAGMLLRSAPSGTTVRLETRVGAYTHSGEPLLTAWPPPPERARDDGGRDRGRRRAHHAPGRRLRDPHVVDIGRRALSPAPTP